MCNDDCDLGYMILVNDPKSNLLVFEKIYESLEEALEYEPLKETDKYVIVKVITILKKEYKWVSSDDELH